MEANPMTHASPSPDPDGQLAEAAAVYADHLADRRTGSAGSIDDLCRAHARIAAHLRTLDAQHGHWRTIVDRLVGGAGATKEPRTAALPAGAPASSALLERLRARTPDATRYRQVDEVGRGGMGAVLRVFDEELQRTLAMKVALGVTAADSGSQRPGDAQRLGRFLEEAQITAQLDHPGIVPVHELGLGSAGEVYFTMRLVKGDDLSKVFAKAIAGHDGWNLTRAVHLLVRVCEAMSYAHDKGVVHRDLKPTNVMVGRYGEVYVMDWGLARVGGQSDAPAAAPAERPASVAVRIDRTPGKGDGASPATLDGDVLGTPVYMAPEQARGDLAAMGPRADIYAVGAMLYQLLTGVAPYCHGGAVTARAALYALLEGPPQAIERLAPNAPEGLAAICEQAMQRDPARRHDSMRRLAEELRAWTEGRVHATRASLFELSHLPPSLVFQYVGSLIAMVGCWVASTVNWDAMTATGRIAYLGASVGALAALGVGSWRRGDVRGAIPTLTGALLSLPCLLFALLHLAPWLAAVAGPNGALELTWTRFDPTKSATAAPDDDADAIAAIARLQRLDLKMLLVFATAAAAAAAVHRAMRSSLFWWLGAAYAGIAVWLLELQFGWRELAPEHAAEWVLAPSLVVVLLGMRLDWRGKAEIARPLLVLGFLAMAGSWAFYAQAGWPVRYFAPEWPRLERSALSFVGGGGIAIALGIATDRIGTRLLRSFAAMPFLVSAAAVLLSLSQLVAEKIVVYEILLPIACFAFVVLAIALQRRNLLYAGGGYLVVAVFQISSNHFEREWAWPLALLTIGVGLAVGSRTLRRWDATTDTPMAA